MADDFEDVGPRDVGEIDSKVDDILKNIDGFRTTNLKEDQAKDFADRLDEVCSRKIRSYPSIGVLS